MGLRSPIPPQVYHRVTNAGEVSREISTNFGFEANGNFCRRLQMAHIALHRKVVPIENIPLTRVLTNKRQPRRITAIGRRGHVHPLDKAHRRGV